MAENWRFKARFTTRYSCYVNLACAMHVFVFFMLKREWLLNKYCSLFLSLKTKLKLMFERISWKFSFKKIFKKYRTEKDTSLQVSTFVYWIITTVIVIFFYESWLKFWQIQYHLLTAYKPLQVPVESRLFTNLVKFNINADEIS